MTAEPRVTVVVPAYNCREHVGTAIRSVLAQTMAEHAIEVIAVDDGSTDGTGDELERLAAEHPRVSVIHQDNSGAAGAPRNRGIERARGDFVFFLDADDHLGPEALQRMCTIADENDTDVVVGNYVGINRGVARFHRTIARIAVTDPDVDVYSRSLTAQKLFRRSLLERHAIRFVEGLVSGEDKLFTAHAYLHARAVSVVADYDCYYLVGRDDGTSITQQGGAAAADYYAHVGRGLVDLVMRHTEPGPVRDRMLLRHVGRDVLHRLSEAYVHGAAQARAETEDGILSVLDGFPVPEVFDRLPAHQRLYVHHLVHGRRPALHEAVRTHLGDEPVRAVVEKDRAFAVYPGFRSPEARIPDAYFDVTGELRVARRITRLEWVDGRLRIEGTACIEPVGATAGQRVDVLLRSKKSDLEFRLPAEAGAGGSTAGAGGSRAGAAGSDDSGPASGSGASGEPGATCSSGERAGCGGSGAFAAEIDIARAADGGPLPAGMWDLYVAVRVGDLVREGRLGATRDDTVSAPPATLVAGPDVHLVVPFFTRRYDNLTLDVDPGGRALQRIMRVDELGWAPREKGRLRVLWRLPLRGSDADRAAVIERLRPRLDAELRGDRERRVSGTVECRPAGEGLELTGILDLRGCDAGRWDLRWELVPGRPGLRAELPVGDLEPPPAMPCDPLRSRHAAPYRTTAGMLAVHITNGGLRRAAAFARRQISG